MSFSISINLVLLDLPLLDHRAAILIFIDDDIGDGFQDPGVAVGAVAHEDDAGVTLGPIRLDLGAVSILEECVSLFVPETTEDSSVAVGAVGHEDDTDVVVWCIRHYFAPAASGRMSQSSCDLGSNLGFSTSNTA